MGGSTQPEDARPDARGKAVSRSAILEYARRHPVIAATLLGCTVVGAALGFAFLADEWSVARRIAAGAVAGGGVGLLLTATKMLD